MIDNAYLVLSIKQIRQLLRQAVASQRRADTRIGIKHNSNYCVVLENIEINRINSAPQIASYSVQNAIEKIK